MNCRIAFLVTAAGIFASFGRAQEIDKTAVKDALALISELHRGPQSYHVKQQVYNRGKLEEITDFDVHLDRGHRCISKSTSFQGFKEKNRIGVSVLLLNDFAVYQVAKHPDARDFQIVMAAPPKDLLNFVGQCGMHFDCIAATGDWLTEWLIEPALRGVAGCELEAFGKSDSGFHGVINCGLPAVAPAGMIEGKPIEFWLDRRAHLAHWQYAYDQTHPSAIMKFEMAWNSRGAYQSTVQTLHDGDELVAKWESLVSNYSNEPIPESQFKLEQFGLSSPSNAISARWVVIGIVLMSAITLYYFCRRK